MLIKGVRKAQKFWQRSREQKMYRRTKNVPLSQNEVYKRPMQWEQSVIFYDTLWYCLAWSCVAMCGLVWFCCWFLQPSTFLALCGRPWNFCLPNFCLPRNFSLLAFCVPELLPPLKKKELLPPGTFASWYFCLPGLVWPCLALFGLEWPLYCLFMVFYGRI